MSHLNTAYKLGAAQASNDFLAHVEKQAQGLEASAPPRIGGGTPIPAPPTNIPRMTPPPKATQLPTRGVGTRAPQPMPARA